LETSMLQFVGQIPHGATWTYRLNPHLGGLTHALGLVPGTGHRKAPQLRLKFVCRFTPVPSNAVLRWRPKIADHVQDALRRGRTEQITRLRFSVRWLREVVISAHSVAHYDHALPTLRNAVRLHVGLLRLNPV